MRSTGGDLAAHRLAPRPFEGQLCLDPCHLALAWGHSPCPLYSCGKMGLIGKTAEPCTAFTDRLRGFGRITSPFRAQLAQWWSGQVAVMKAVRSKDKARAQGWLRCTQTSVPLLSIHRSPQAPERCPLPGSLPVMAWAGHVTSLSLPPLAHTVMLPRGLRDSHGARTRESSQAHTHVNSPP